MPSAKCSIAALTLGLRAAAVAVFCLLLGLNALPPAMSSRSRLVAMFAVPLLQIQLLLVATPGLASLLMLDLSLQLLDLHNNSFSGTLPSDLGLQQNLQYLDLSMTRLRWGAIPMASATRMLCRCPPPD